jgi:3-oxoadipate enol-lactonase
MPSIPVNGTALYYEERGSGPPVLFVHGMCGFAGVWDDQVDRLTGDFRCVTYDRRGHSRSPLGEVGQRTVELHADDAAGLIRALDLAPCLLVGSSGGARVALDVVRRYPELLAGAVLSEPPVFALDPAGGAEVMADLKPALRAAVEGGGPPAAVDAFFDYMCPGLWRAIDEGRRDPYRANAGELLPDLQMPPYRVTPGDLAQVRVPCLVLKGDRSNPSLRRIADTIAASIPDAELVELRGSGHVTYAEQPEAFAAALRAFATRHGGSSAEVSRRSGF